MRIKGIPLIILTFGTLLLGAWSSFGLFRFLAQNVRESNPRKDTVYIQLVNGLPFRTDSMTRNDKSQVAIRKAGNPGTEIPAATLSDSNSKPFQNTFLLRPPVVPVSDSTRTSAISAGRLSQTTFPWWLAVCGFFFVLAIGLLLLYNRLPILSTDLQKDLDPKELTDVFRNFSDPIEAIGNPRKIKRLSNKVRFQYHYITGKGWTAPDILAGLMTILLTLESKPWLSAPSGTAVKPDLDSEDNFWNYFATSISFYPTIVTNKKLQHLIYILNRDPL